MPFNIFNKKKTHKIIDHMSKENKSTELSNITLDIMGSRSDDKSDNVIGTKYKLHEKLGKGSFGIVYRATDKNNLEYAIKIEDISDKKKHLLRESEIYDSIKSKTFQYDFAQKYHYSEHKDNRVLVLQKLGKSLKYYNNKYIFDLNTISNIAVQILYRLENLHSLGWLHQDIKPENILVDNVKGKKLFLVDFGTSGRWADSDIKHHIPKERTTRIVGTARYSSINNHRGITQSRKDDLESFGYVLLFLILGRLPWQGVTGKNFRKKWNSVLAAKSKIDIIHLCETNQLDNAFSNYFLYINKLKFEEKPDYKYLRKIFRKNIKSDFFWSQKKNKN